MNIMPTETEYAANLARVKRLCARFPAPSKGQPSGGYRIQQFVLTLTGKEKSALLTNAEWRRVFDILDAAGDEETATDFIAAFF